MSKKQSYDKMLLISLQEAKSNLPQLFHLAELGLWARETAIPTLESMASKSKKAQKALRTLAKSK